MKKILGFLLLAVGGFIAISLFEQIPPTIEKFKDTSKIEAKDPDNYLLGIVIAGVLLLIISMTAIYFGFQMLKKAYAEVKIPQKDETIKK
ncbi:hypothetical protein [Kordia sp.]|uniref:hypothetical protein n=1 Tax=Kordia sp. TaxID=1965332 RepID=UPI003D6AC846